MAIVAGIDEAGYGPLLGPLVVAASAFRLEDAASEAALHRLMALPSSSGGLPIEDSKRLYRARGDRARLEAAALGHVAIARGELPLRARALLRDAVDCHVEELLELPWYGTRLLDLRLPRAAAVDELLARAARQEELFADRGLALAGLWCAPVVEPRFNQLTRQRGSKAWPLFLATGRLLDTLMAAFPDEELVVHVDRQGGRIHYGELLAGFFPLAPIRTLRERRSDSAYRLSLPGRPPVTVSVHVRGDSTRAPVALASILAKAVRELFMESLNAFFAERVADLRPTAGYPQDARRFLADVAPALAEPDVRARLVRIR